MNRRPLARRPIALESIGVFDRGENHEDRNGPVEDQVADRGEVAA